jgi:adenosylcobinamide-GDP ribazoletransferase
MLESLIIAFSMYSKIPMPHVKWTEKGMRYSMCFFPFVGAVTGLISVLAYRLCVYLNIGNILAASVLTILPILINGGIHMDGFLDTIDARRSYKSKEERLEILKDPHTGAFAIIYACVYFICIFGLFSELISKIDMETNSQLILFPTVGYFMSRVLSAFSVVTFPKAKKDGSMAAFADASKKQVRIVLVIEFLLCCVFYISLNPIIGSACIFTALIIFAYYYIMSNKVFGGITGDIAGYFLQLCEFGILLATVAVSIA